MANDIVKILREELIDLRDNGCDFVQFDEPVLTEIIMSEECDRRTFMWATLATRRDAGKELKFAADLINRIVKHRFSHSFNRHMNINFDALTWNTNSALLRQAKGVFWGGDSKGQSEGSDYEHDEENQFLSHQI